MRIKQYIFLLPLALMLLLVTSELVERSMYTDGVAYAGIAANLAEGVGGFWSPTLSEVHNTRFRGHPPLAFGLQSVFFRLFGDGLVTERLYAGSVFLLSALLIVLLWRLLLRDYPAGRELWFLPLTLWLANEVVYHFYPANVLEPTLGLFALAAVYAGLRALDRPAGNGAWIGAVLLGLLTFCATLAKGFVGLFPLALYGLYWLIYRRLTIGRAVVLTAAAMVSLGIAYGLLWQYEPARLFLTEYYEQQVRASVSGEVTTFHFRDSRWYIVRRTLEVLLPAIGLAGLLVGVGWKRFKDTLRDGPQVKAGLLMITIGLSASLPLAISPKQSFYYLLPSMSYFALGLGALCIPVVAAWYERPARRWERWVLPVLCGGLVLAGVLNTARHWGQMTRRDRTVLRDMDQLATIIPAQTTVGTVGDVGDLVSYYYRHHRVSLDTAAANVQLYPLVVVREGEAAPRGYERVELNTERYRLYRRPETGARTAD